MEQQEIENLQTAFGALNYAIEKADARGGVILADGMIAFNKAIKEYIHKHVWEGSLFRVNPSSRYKMQQTILEDAYDYALTMIQISRQEEDDYDGQPVDVAVAHYGPFVVNQDGSIDRGGKVSYHHPNDWHKDQHHFSHMFMKNWVCASLEDYIRALAHSAKIQGLESFTINVDRISTK